MDDQLTPQAREAIRSFVWRLALIPGFLATTLAAIAGFGFGHWLKNIETETRLTSYEDRLRRQEQEQDGYFERVGSLIATSSGLAVEADRLRSDIAVAQSEIESINKILAEFGVSDALRGELEKIRDRIIDDDDFRNGITQSIGLDVVNTINQIEIILTNSIQSGVSRCNSIPPGAVEEEIFFPDEVERVRLLAEVQFDQSFSEVPHIFLSHQHFEIETRDDFIEFAIFPSAVSNAGFSLNVIGDDDTLYGDCAISWIAFDKRMGTFQNIESIDYTDWVD